MGDVVVMGKGAVGVEVCASLGSGSVAAYRERRRKFKHMCLRIIPIRAPRAGSDKRDRRDRVHGLISIRAPHAGSDPRRPQAARALLISIHAPRAGSDCEFRQCIPQYGMA